MTNMMGWEPQTLEESYEYSYNLLEVLSQKMQARDREEKKEELVECHFSSEFFYTKDSVETPFDVKVTPIIWNKQNAYLLIFSEVSKNALAHRNKLEEVFKDRFLASLSHELRTPLNGISGFTEHLKNCLKPIKNPDILEAISGIESNYKVLLVFIDSLLDVMMIEKDKSLKLRTKNIGVAVFTHEIEIMIRSYLRKKAVRFFLNVAPDVPDVIQIDEDRVREALLHLILNAIKFTLVGTISLTIERCPDEPDLLLFHVEDTGIGLNHEEKINLFQVPINADKNTYSQGIGLGLAISQKLAKVLGKSGSPYLGVKVESEPSKGSKFTISVCINYRQVREGTNLKLNEKKWASSTNTLLKVKGDSSFQSDAIPNERGEYEKKIKIFRTHESLEFGKSDGGGVESLRLSYLLGSPKNKTQELKEPKFHHFSSQEDLKTEQPFIFTPKSEESHAELSEVEENDRLASEESCSSRFHSPTHGKHAPEKRSRFSLLQQQKKSKMLVVDDNDFNLIIAVRFLQELGYQVKTANNGKEAIELIERECLTQEEFFKVIFMDCQMPIMDGYQATQILKEMMMKDQIPLTPIVAITANKNEKDIDRCYESGMDGYLSKPIKKEMLQNQIKELFPEDGV